MGDNGYPGAIVQRDGETYAIVPRTPLGLVTPEQLESIARVARTYSIPILKISSGQRIVLVGIKPADIDAVWRELSMEVGEALEPCMHYVQACPGTEVCRYGQQDSLGLGAALDKKFVGMDLPGKAKIGVSGCPMNCAESYMRDFGAVGRRNGWTVSFGGNAASRPRVGDVIAKDISADEVIALAEKCFAFYAANANKKERTARFIDRIGIEELKKNVIE